jgi:hypothetical protein
MKLFASRRLRHRAFVCAAVLGLTLSAAAAAQAFTFEDPGSAGARNGGQGFTDLDNPAARDPDAQVSRFGSGGQTSLKQGNTTLRFGAQPSFDQRYDSNNLFDPFARDGR